MCRFEACKLFNDNFSNENVISYSLSIFRVKMFLLKVSEIEIQGVSFCPLKTQITQLAHSALADQEKIIAGRLYFTLGAKQGTAAA